LMCRCWQDVSVGTNARKLFNKHINYLSSATCHQLVLHTVGKIDEMFHDSLKPRVDSGVTRAVGTAKATVDKWGAKVSSTAICAVFCGGCKLICDKIGCSEIHIRTIPSLSQSDAGIVPTEL